MTFGNIVLTIQQELKDLKEREWDVSYIKRMVNMGQRDFARRVGFPMIEGTRSLSAVANKLEYTIPSAIRKIKSVDYISDLLRYIGQRDYKRLMWDTNNVGVPTMWNVWQRRLRLNPKPDTAAFATTLNGAHSASVTTFTVTDGTNFPVTGRAVINSEVIFWSHKSGNSLQNVTRGEEGTTASSHSDTDAITVRDVVMEGYVYPDDMSANSEEPEIAYMYPDALIEYGLFKCLRGKNATQAGRHLSTYESVVERAIIEVGDKQDEEWSTTLDDTQPISVRDNTEPVDGSLS